MYGSDSMILVKTAGRALPVIAFGVPVLLAACAHSGAMLGGATAAANAYAVVNDSSGNAVGTAALVQDAAGVVHIEMHAKGLTPGAHGVHFHAVGSCIAPAFASAGGHFNPEGKHHGLSNPAGPHAGDLPNMTADADGNADYTAMTSRVSLTPGAKSLLDADGSALVIHASPDDNMTDPAGNAGARIGCGVVQSGVTPAP
jgi:Cu-Zn family superoxide dismutase